jgi:L-alanine-DL-glutamate epimerase-like enolase superfamily enzyme
MERAKSESAPVEEARVSAYAIPTRAPESDGTLEWDHTTLVLVETRSGSTWGLGYSYADAATAQFIRDSLAPLIEGRDAMAVPGAWSAMETAIRNSGQAGIAAMAVSAVDTSLWDLKAKRLGLPLVALFGAVRDAIPIYGSGGFTSYDDDQLLSQMTGWASEGISKLKMKVGRDPGDDLRRARIVREAVGPGPELFVDANGAYSRKQALRFAEAFAELGATWFEEPVPSDDLEGLRLLRDRGPGGMAIAAGEYGYRLPYFRRMLEAGAVDVLQADATRCMGFTGFRKAAALCEANLLPFSSHCAPALHLHACCALEPAVHMEYFYDHARIERLLFDGAPVPENGALKPDLTRPGLGLEFKRADAERYRL